MSTLPLNPPPHAPRIPLAQGERLVEARGLTVRAGRRELLSSVDMAVHASEIVTLIGPNGAGKTTLVRALLGILRPSDGEIWRRPGLRIGYLPQRMHVEPTLPLTVHRFLTLAYAADGDAVRAALAEVGAERLEHQLLSELSGGEFQRVLMARALVRNPELLILDEPVQGVDVSGQLDLYDLIAHIRDAHGCGVLLISHDLHLVMSATDRVVCLNQHVCCHGHPESVLRDPAYLNLFGPRAASGLAVYTHARGHDHAHHGRPPHAPDS
ncbi:MAG TPA: metal ABC transporter ATP-binding protein [bacterium]|nr:metal ABC transporter ATP-binding protein [bacterium]